MKFKIEYSPISKYRVLSALGWRTVSRLLEDHFVIPASSVKIEAKIIKEFSRYARHSHMLIIVDDCVYAMTCSLSPPYAAMAVTTDFTGPLLQINSDLIIAYGTDKPAINKAVSYTLEGLASIFQD